MTTPDSNGLQDDIAALKRDVARLITHLSAGATDRVQGAAGSVEHGARQLYRGAVTEGEASVAAISQQVQAQPLLALLIAMGVGYIGSRLFSR